MKAEDGRLATALGEVWVQRQRGRPISVFKIFEKVRTKPTVKEARKEEKAGAES
jgi:hypothetical protein